MFPYDKFLEVELQTWRVCASLRLALGPLEKLHQRPLRPAGLRTPTSPCPPRFWGLESFQSLPFSWGNNGTLQLFQWTFLYWLEEFNHSVCWYLYFLVCEFPWPSPLSSWECQPFWYLVRSIFYTVTCRHIIRCCHTNYNDFAYVFMCLYVVSVVKKLRILTQTNFRGSSFFGTTFRKLFSIPWRKKYLSVFSSWVFQLSQLSWSSASSAWDAPPPSAAGWSLLIPQV